jgi:prepilin-type processing-associated H-X9-DG protein
LLVVVGIIALLISVLLPPLRAAHDQALDTRCKMQEQQLGVSLEAARFEHEFYPLWDDGGSPIRYTWIDVLIQNRHLSNPRAGYCPKDPQPSDVNAARGQYYQVRYPGPGGIYGIDYSYGIGVPLSAAGWIWRSDFNDPEDADKSRYFDKHDRYPAQRVLAADSTWSTIYNLSGYYVTGHDWSYRSWYDNTVDWRHRGLAANALFQDGHVDRLQYLPGVGIDTARYFVWNASEPQDVGPPDKLGDHFYPSAPPINPVTGEMASNYPEVLYPGYFTDNMLWTQIFNK